MITSYILILCLSTGLFVYGLLQLSARMARLLGPSATIPPALCVGLPMIAFLVVVGAAPAMLVASTVLLVSGMATAGQRVNGLFRVGLPLVMGALVGFTMHLPATGSIPPLAIMLAGALFMAGVVYAASYAPTQPGPLHAGFMACLVPLIAAPWFGAPASIALDVAIISSGLLAALLGVRGSVSMATARAPLAMMTAWLVVQAAVHGAWILAIVTSLAMIGVIAYGMTRAHAYPEFHAL